MGKNTVPFILLWFVATTLADLLVTLPNGQIKGHALQTFTNRTYYAYQAIPYAEPPLGKLRFQAPQPAKNWEGILDVTEQSNICFQITSDSPKESEDCLYINVFTPVLDAEKNGTKLPVIFFVYGGGFRAGSSDFDRTRPDNLIDEGVVVVTFNYRVGTFGFLSTEDLVVPGNAGLKDQHLALKWTNDNIALFGGDASKITIYGQSAGAASIGYQLLSKLNTGLFRAAIIQSGSPLNEWTYLDTQKEYVVQLAQQLNESISMNDDSTYLLEFLQSVPAKDIDDACKNTTIRQPNPTVEPEHDGAFLTEKMYELFDSGDFIQVPTIIGICSEERIGDAHRLTLLNRSARAFDANPETLVPVFIPLKDGYNLTEAGEFIKSVYVGNDSFVNHLGRTIRYASDNRFGRGVLKQAQLMAQYTDVHFYVFSYDGIHGGNNVTIDDAENVGHAEDLYYVFSSQSDDELVPSDATTVKRLINLWTTFAKTLNPTPEKTELLQNIIWPKVTPDSYQYLDIDENLSIKTNPKSPWFDGWIAFFDKFGQRPFVTY